MKFAMIFLVLSLVVLMAEQGECRFRRVMSTWRGLKQRWRGKSQVNTHSIHLNIPQKTGSRNNQRQEQTVYYSIVRDREFILLVVPHFTEICF
uniref:Uncharacterized protein n=1 Tax=Monopterus albus TaxID=43700 RepID=A0A3Q3JR84_MONAL